MRVNITDADDYLDDSTLDEGMYEVEVVKAEARDTRSGFPMLIMEVVVSDGPTQMNSKSPYGAEATIFVVLDENASEKPKGRKLIKERVGNVFSSFGVSLDEEDEHVFVGRKALAKIRPGEDRDGFPINDVRRFKKLPV